MKPLLLTPEEEAHIICYIAFYYNCDKGTCWTRIREIIQKYGSRRHKIVYRGQASKNNTIKSITPFFSSTTNKVMADLFVEKNWALSEGSRRIGHLFKVHLKRAPWLSTRSIKYTFTNEVKEELRKIIKGGLIEKGDGTYTLDTFFPKLKGLIKDLVFTDTTDNGEEILVMTGGTFYNDSTMKVKGFMPINSNDFETWYSLS
jgi:hypothetical protein